MKIAIFTDTFIPNLDGIVISTINIANELANRGHKICIIVPKIKGVKEGFKHKNIKVLRVSSIPAFFYPGFRLTSIINIKILNYLIKKDIDIIHFQTPFTLGFQAILLSKLLGVPLVGTFHTKITHNDYIKHLGLPVSPLKALSWQYIKLFYNRCDLVTCPTQSIKEELFVKLKSPIKIISNGIKFGVCNHLNYKELRRKYLKDDWKLLLFVGRIAHEKNLSYLLECFKIVLKKRPKTKLLIVGDGPQMRELKEKIFELHISKKVILAGRIEHDNLLKDGIFKICDLFVTASETETQGISTLEAQANGLVCLCADSTGSKDIIKDNFNGLLIKKKSKKEFADKILFLLSSNKDNKRLKRCALKEVKKYNIKKIAKIWEKEYKNLTKNI